VKIRRTLMPVLAAALVTPGVALAAANPVQTSSCKAPTGILRTNPVKTMSLPGGATVRIWDTGDRKRNVDEMRLVAIRIPRGSLIPRAITSSSLSKAATPQTQAKNAKRAVVVVNGGVFDPSGPSIPVRSEVIHGNVRKGTRGVDQALALYEGTRTAEWTLHKTTGEVTSGVHGDRPLGAVNWQSLSGSGINVYTRSWGSSAHPTGNRTVVVKGGKVVKQLTGARKGQRRPRAGELYLTARGGSDASWLASLRVGEPVTVHTRQSGVLPFVDGRPDVGRPDSLIGVSAGLVRAGVNWASCSARDETLRPRSGMAWAPNGDLIVAAVAGRPTAALGGSSAHQWGEYLKQLGGINAVNFDGGSSVTLLVRTKVGGPLIRLDRSAAGFQRAVPDALTFVVP
jgi:hypothetical protein